MVSKTQQFAFITTVAIVTVATLLFGIYQNAGNRLGGGISTPKILWLNFALIAFFVIPGFLGKTNRAFRFVWWSFLIRAVVEGYLLTQTDLWRCWMGISHCLITLLGFHLLLPRPSQDRIFVWIVSTALLVECSMAWLFSKVANPEEGVYFAPPSPEFASINTYTLAVVTIAYPCLIVAIIIMMKGGDNGEAVTI